MGVTQQDRPANLVERSRPLWALLSSRRPDRVPATGLILDDIDWQSGEMVISAKGRRRARMPIPQEAGEYISTAAALESAVSPRSANSTIDSFFHARPAFVSRPCTLVPSRLRRAVRPAAFACALQTRRWHSRGYSGANEGRLDLAGTIALTSIHHANSFHLRQTPMSRPGAPQQAPSIRRPAPDQGRGQRLDGASGQHGRKGGV